MTANQLFEKIYTNLLSDRTRQQSEKVILVIAIASFLVHLTLISLVNFGVIPLHSTADLLRNPIAAIYTPFSFILVYEVYLLVHYLPQSITTYISKQYEIITLIIIRRLFKDLSTLVLSPDWFQSKNDLQFTYDLAASVLLFYLIFQFHQHSRKQSGKLGDNKTPQADILRFIKIKKALATALVPILVAVAIYSFVDWALSIFHPGQAGYLSFKNINNIFFEQFFTVLIVSDVFLLLFSFFHTDEFHKVIRNSGFIISTILIRLSFSVTGLLNTALITTAVIFGLAILVVHNKFEQQLHPAQK